MGTFEVKVGKSVYRVNAADEDEAWDFANYEHEKLAEQPTSTARAAGLAVRGLAPPLVGAAAGATLGMLGGPAAPVTVPAGVIAGGAAVPLADAATNIYNTAGKLLGVNPKYLADKYPSQVIEEWLTRQGLPEAKNTQERMLQSAASAVGGVGSGVGAGRALVNNAASPMAQKIGRMLSERPLVQGAVAAPTAAGATGVAEETGNPYLGLAAGLAIPAGLAAGGAAARYAGRQAAGNWMGAANQDNMAGRKLAQAFERDELTPDQAGRRVAALGDEAALMDVGTNTQALAAAVARVPGAGKTKIERFVNERQAGVRDVDNVMQGGMADRLGRILDRITPERFRGSKDALDKKRKIASEPLYSEAYGAPGNQSLDSAELRSIEATPAGKRAVNWAREQMLNERNPVGRPDAELTEQARSAGIEGGGKVPRSGVASGAKLEYWNYVKRGLYKEIGDLKKAGDADGTRIVTGLWKSLVKELDSLDVTQRTGPNSVRPDGGAYKRARAAYSGPSQLTDAMEDGRNIFTPSAGNADDIAKAVRDMSPDEAHAYRVGVTQSLRDSFGKVLRTGDATRKLMGTPDIEDKVRAAFVDAATFRRYIGDLENERTKFNTFAGVTGNSKTAERSIADQELKNDPGAAAQDVASIVANPTNPASYIRAAARYGGRVLGRMDMGEPVRNRLADMLQSSDTAHLKNTLLKAIEANRKKAAGKMAIAVGGAQGNAAYLRDPISE